MSYQVLARKWRPAKFEQVVGQSHVLHALTNALTQNRLHHAYLFSGTRGVGKTSLARLFAKGLNCEQGITATPCGECSSCVEIAQGRFVDLIEVDAASRTKVDDTRELLDNVQYRPSRGRYKVYLIDEVHMLSRSSFNALLKTLEEPPEHVKFLLATTDPQRLPVTVLSRCLQFNLKSLTLDEICQQLATILAQEDIAFDDGAIKLLAKAANGSMRDALSLADQAIAFGAGQVQLNQVQTMLGTIDEHYVIVLLKALCDGDVANLMQVTDEVLSYGADPFEVLRSLLELLHQITLTQFAPAAAQLSRYAEQIKAFAEQLRPEQVQLYYQLLLTGRKDLPHAPDPKSGLEMALLRAIAFVPEAPVKRWQVEANHKVTLPTSAANAAEVATSEVRDDSQAKHDHVSSNETSQALASQPSVAVSKPALDTAAQAGDEHSKHLSSGSDIDEASEPAQTEEPGNIDCDDTALLAEQALILSQAQSQGGPVAAEEADDYLIPQGYLDDVDEVNDADPSDYEAYLASQMQANDSGQTAVADAYQTPYGTTHEPVSSANDEAGANADLALNKAPEQEADLFSDDDVLDAVLSARQSLLSDLDETSSKESDTKKPEAGRQAFVPPKREASSSQADELAAVVSEAASLTHKSDQASALEHTAGNSVMVNEPDDRPPWEAPVQAQDPTTDDKALLTPDTSHEPESQLTQAQSSAAAGATQTMMSQQAEPENIRAVQDSMQMPEASEQTHLPTLTADISGNEIDLQWYRLMSALDIGGRVRQLAVNSVCQQFVDPLPLVLKPNQKHLAAPGAVQQLEAALSKALEGECTVTITVGMESNRETPLEIRQRFHRELLGLAHHELLNDDNIRWLSETMNAQMEPDSLSYAPERLGQRGKTIALINKSNFIAKAES